jgi:light-regulated signal transduction histidine kinase (bacteriophytochrome)
LTSGEPFKVECLLKRASDGAYRWHLSQARPVRNTQGKIVRWFGACSDVDDYKQAASENQTLNEHLETRVRERTAELDLANQQLSHANAELHVSALRLEQTNRELQDFASVTSHDLQEPLRKVQAFGDRLNIECRRQIHERGRGYLDRMLNSTKRMQSLIEDLLRFAHVTSQARPFFPVDLAQVAREVVSDLEVRILETKALVQLGALPTIDADAVQMRQLLQNLIGNALKFHLPGVPPVVRVYAESFDSPAAEPMIRLIVHDKGIGFDEKYLDRIFTVFQRLHDEAQYPGTGIGLAICRKIVQRHGGGITAKSSPGHGASFLVELPFRPASGIGLTLPPSAVDTPIGTPGDRNSSAPPGTEKIS